MMKTYIAPTQETGAALFKRNLQGEVIMLNLLRFKDIADYSEHPELAPEQPISGREAFQKYIDHTLPFLKESGGDILLFADAGAYFIGPTDEQWDFVMLIQQRSIESFFAFASNEACMVGNGHRSAAILDSRLLPIQATQGSVK